MDSPTELGGLLTLPFECLLEIVSNLSLPECIPLRSTCHQLKAAIDYHFRTGVRTLPVLLSARYSPEECREFNELSRKFNYDFDSQTMTFGSGLHYRKLREEKKMFMEQKKHFRLENYLVLFDLAKFDSFVDFITKYFLKIHKLALVIDHDDHLERIPEVLNIYRKQLEVLLLEKTLRSSIEVPDIDDSIFGDRSVYPYLRKCIYLTTEFYHSFESLETLEELYFFPKWSNRFPSVQYLDRLSCETRQQFLKSMLKKLRVLHIAMSCDIGKENYESSCETDEKLEELACHSSALHSYFPPFLKLRKCIFKIDATDSEYYYPNGDLAIFPTLNIDCFMPNLKKVRFSCALTLNDWQMDQINLLSLEQIHCKYIDFQNFNLPRSLNRTIREFELDFLRPPWEPRPPDEDHLRKILECLTIFTSLEKLIVREPFMELTEKDFKDFNDYRIVEIFKIFY